MLNISSIVIGVIALILAIFAFIPLLGWANWVIIPIAVVGLALGAMSDRTAGRNLNIVVIVIGVIRLMLGGGII
jgi:TRAP-type mannitol/chloroaromatic compound transport system permease small subunit